MASRDHVQGPDLTALNRSMFILKRLMWVPNCRHLFVPFENQLHVIVNKASGNSQKGMLACCMNLVSMLPQFVHDLCDSFVLKLDGVTDCTVARNLLSWVNGWVFSSSGSKWYYH